MVCYKDTCAFDNSCHRVNVSAYGFTPIMESSLHAGFEPFHLTNDSVTKSPVTLAAALQDDSIVADERVTACAAYYGRLETLQWAHARLPWDVRTCRFATAGASLECLQYAFREGCPVDVETFSVAVRTAHEGAALFLLSEEVQCPVAPDIYEIAKSCEFESQRANSIRMLFRLQKHNVTFPGVPVVPEGLEMESLHMVHMSDILRNIVNPVHLRFIHEHRDVLAEAWNSADPAFVRLMLSQGIPESLQYLLETDHAVPETALSEVIQCAMFKNEAGGVACLQILQQHGVPMQLPDTATSRNIKAQALNRRFSHPALYNFLRNQNILPPPASFVPADIHTPCAFNDGDDCGDNSAIDYVSRERIPAHRRWIAPNGRCWDINSLIWCYGSGQRVIPDASNLPIPDFIRHLELIPDIED
jgi:hypothetical protein